MTTRGPERGAPTLIVSPHFDDAVLSAWALIDAPGTAPVDVLTVFGGAPEPPMATAADRSCGFANSTDAMRARRLEEAAALSSATRRTWHLQLVELQYGGLAARDDARDRLSAEVATWLEAQRGPNGARPLVVVPGGAGVHVAAGLSKPSGHGSRARGGSALAWLRLLKHRLYVRRKRAAQRGGAVVHPDHLFVRDVVVEVCGGRSDVELWLYEDLPYLWSGSADHEVAHVAQARGWIAELTTFDIDRNRKCAALSNYASQLRALDPDGRRLESAETLPSVERYWRLIRPDRAR